MIEYEVGQSGQVLVFSDTVLKHFRRHRQTRPWQKEAGGQLFARIALPRIVVSEATGPRPTDRRTRTSYQPDRAAEQREILERHARGLHFIGDWHTHPETRPAPSGRDHRSIADCFVRSTHGLNAFVLVIVGTAALQEALYVAVHNAELTTRLIAREARGPPPTSGRPLGSPVDS